MFKLIFKKFLYYLIYLIDTYQHKDLNKKDKLIKTINLQGKLKSDIGRIETKQIHLTKPFKIYELITDNNKLYCADEHIVFLESGEEIYVKDLANGMLIKSYKGLDVVVSIKELGLSNYMYDVSVETPNRYFTNGILSHNTICSSIFMLWYITFEVDKNIMIVANKGDTVNEIINKVKDIYKHLPFFIKTGVSILNERTIRVDTDCRIMGAARSKEPAIGFTIDVLYMDEFAHIPKNIIEPYYENAFPTVSSLTHSKVIITSTPNGINLFYDLLTAAETTDISKKSRYVPMRVYWHQVPGRDTILIEPNINVLKAKKIELVEFKNFLESEGFEFIKEQRIDSDGIRLHYKHEKLNYDNILEVSALRFKDEFITQYCLVSSLKNSEVNNFGGGQKGLEKFAQQYDLLFSVGSKLLFGGHIMSSLNASCRVFEYIDIPQITDNIAFEVNELRLIAPKKGYDDYFDVSCAKDYYIVVAIDLAEGLGKDYLVANIFKLMPISIEDLGKNNIFSNISEFFSLLQIGIYYNNLISVEEFAEFVYLLVFEFFDPEKVKVVVESNTYGDEFIKSMQYAQGGVNNFGSHVFVKYKHSHNANIMKPGIRLNNINRAMLIKTFQGMVEKHKIKIFEKTTIDELATFTKQESRAGNVKYEAEIGHDDIIMSMVNLSSIFETTELKNMCEIYFDLLSTEHKELINSRLKNVFLETIDYEMTAMKNKKSVTDHKLSKMEEQIDLLNLMKNRKSEYDDDDDGVSSKDILYGSGFNNRL